MAHLGPLPNRPEDIAKDEARRARAYEEERPRRLEIHQTCEIPDYNSGKIVCLASDSLVNLNPPPKTNKSLFATRRNPTSADVDHTDISLYNSIDELILHLSIRRQQGVIVFNSRASRTLHHGWGPEEVVKLEGYIADISRSDRILVYDLGDRFQIIFGLTTIHYFVKRFSNGIPVKISYSATVQYATEGNLLLSQVIFISVFNLDDLPPYEKEIIEAYWKSRYVSVFFLGFWPYVIFSAGVGGVLRNVTSQRRTCPLATLSWDNGKEASNQTFSRERVSDIHSFESITSVPETFYRILYTPRGKRRANGTSVIFTNCKLSCRQNLVSQRSNGMKKSGSIVKEIPFTIFTMETLY